MTPERPSAEQEAREWLQDQHAMLEHEKTSRLAALLTSREATLERELAEARTVLEARQSAFGSTQLTHALARRDAELAEARRERDALRDEMQRVDTSHEAIMAERDAAQAMCAQLREALEILVAASNETFTGDMDDRQATLLEAHIHAAAALAASAESTAAFIAGVERGARGAEEKRCIGIAEYSINDAALREKIVARIREGHEQHTNAKEPRP